MTPETFISDSPRCSACNGVGEIGIPGLVCRVCAATVRRKAKAELRNARKAFKDAQYAIRQAQDGLTSATKRLLAAAKAAGETP